MSGFVINTENETVNNQNFRKVLFTTKNSQLVLMTLEPSEDIGLEVHEGHDQIIGVKTGVAKVVIDGEESMVGPDYLIIVPAGSEHNVINHSADEKLRIFTIYTPPEHPEDTIHRTRDEAMDAETDH